MSTSIGTPASPVGLGARLDAAVRGLTPGYFALVMATGILSIAMRANGWEPLSVAMLGITVVAYAVLVTLTVIRIVRHRAAFLADIVDPGRAFGIFTFVAGTCVLGSRLGGEVFSMAALVLLLIGSVAWLVLGYIVPWTATLGQRGRTALSTANGTWFIWAVASQSIAVLAATLEVELTTARPALALLAVVSWSVGTFLYCAVGVFVAVRLLAYPFRPADLTPPYWVAMGATAITVSRARASSRWRTRRWSPRRGDSSPAPRCSSGHSARGSFPRS